MNVQGLRPLVILCLLAAHLHAESSDSCANWCTDESNVVFQQLQSPSVKNRCQGEFKSECGACTPLCACDNWCIDESNVVFQHLQFPSVESRCTGTYQSECGGCIPMCSEYQDSTRRLLQPVFTAEPTRPPSPSPTAFQGFTGEPTRPPSPSPIASTITGEPTPLPSASPTVTMTEAPTVTPSSSPTATMTEAPTVTPSSTPSSTPTASFQSSPTEPTPEPTAEPTPTASPTASFQSSPTEPTPEPTSEPTMAQTASPTEPSPFVRCFEQKEVHDTCDNYGPDGQKPCPAGFTFQGLHSHVTEYQCQGLVISYNGAAYDYNSHGGLNACRIYSTAGSETLLVHDPSRRFCFNDNYQPM